VTQIILTNHYYQFYQVVVSYKLMNISRLEANGPNLFPTSPMSTINHHFHAAGASSFHAVTIFMIVEYKNRWAIVEAS
jgi:hypothetical protein